MKSINAEALTVCVFYRIVRGELTPEVLAFCDRQTAVFPSLHQQPHNQGHMLVVPTRHVAQIYEIDDELAGPLMTTLACTATAVKAVCGADGISIRQNNEWHGGQDIFHVHFHVIPRFADDGFTTGQNRFLFGAVEVSLEERVTQAKKVSAALALPLRKVSEGTG